MFKTVNSEKNLNVKWKYQFTKWYKCKTPCLRKDLKVFKNIYTKI